LLNIPISIRHGRRELPRHSRSVTMRVQVIVPCLSQMLIFLDLNDISLSSQALNDLLRSSGPSVFILVVRFQYYLINLFPIFFLDPSQYILLRSLAIDLQQVDPFHPFFLHPVRQSPQATMTRLSFKTPLQQLIGVRQQLLASSYSSSLLVPQVTFDQL